MTPEQLRAIIEEAVAGRVSAYMVAAGLIALLGAGLGAWLGSYLHEKGKNYATREDLRQILEQLRETTRVTEGVRAQIAGGLWLEQKRWDLRRDLYWTLLRNLGELIDCTASVRTLLERLDEAEEAEREGLRNAIRDFEQRRRRAIDEVRGATSVSAMILPAEAMKSLEEMLEGWGRAADAADYRAFLHQWGQAAGRAHDLLIEVARGDLGMALGRRAQR